MRVTSRDPRASRIWSAAIDLFLWRADFEIIIFFTHPNSHPLIFPHGCVPMLDKHRCEWMDQTPKYTGRPLGPSGMHVTQLESRGNHVGIMLGHVTSLGGLVH